MVSSKKFSRHLNKRNHWSSNKGGGVGNVGIRIINFLLRNQLFYPLCYLLPIGIRQFSEHLMLIYSEEQRFLTTNAQMLVCLNVIVIHDSSSVVLTTLNQVSQDH